MSITYRRDYQELGLDESADWPTARAAYRRLVNTWHPDRYARRPRESEHARQRFIRLTRSFDRLRAFHRENARLPFETVVPAASEALRAHRVERVRDEHRRRASAGAVVEQELSGDELLGRRGAARVSDRIDGRTGRGGAGGAGGPGGAGGSGRAGVRRRFGWLVGALGVIGITVVAFAWLDRSESRASYDNGRDVLLETAPSEFMPSAAEVRRQSTRGTFVTREDGELGDQLMEDMFR